MYDVFVEILLPRVQLKFKQDGLARLGYKNLAEYRASPWWQWFKADYYRRHRHAYRCVDCGATHGLEIDHESYEHLGCERDSEVANRCDTCHVKKHERWNAIARAEMNGTKKPLPSGKGRSKIRRVLYIIRMIFYYMFRY